MSTASHAIMLADAISEGVNWIVHIQSLRTAAHVMTADELTAWRAAVDAFQDSLNVVRAGLPGFVIQISMEVSDDLFSRVEQLRAHLTSLAPGSPLLASFFDAVDAVRAEFDKAAQAQGP